MRDNTEISDIFERSCHGSILACQRKFAADSRRANESQSIRAARCLPSCAKRLRCRRKIRTERSEEHTSELQSLMRISYAVFCLKKKKQHNNQTYKSQHQSENTK